MKPGSLYTASVGAILGYVGSAAGQCSPEWVPIPMAGWLDAEVKAMTVWDVDGSGPLDPVLVATGNFLEDSQTYLRFVGSWNGISWLPMAGGLPADSGKCISLFDPDGSGPNLAMPVVGGASTSSGGLPVDTPVIWTGTTWQTIGGGIAGGPFPDLLSLASYQNNLFIGGFFESAGGVPANRCARWDGLSWQATDPRWVNGGYYSMHVHKGGLYVGGSFGMLGEPYGVLRWDGTKLDPVPGAPSNGVYAMTSYQGKLIAGGFFFPEPGRPQPGHWIAQWDGQAWGPLGTGMNSTVNALTTFDPDGPGSMPELLIAGGLFSSAGGVPASRIAAWDGTQWSNLGPGVNGQVRALCVFQNQLHVGGSFTTAGGQASPFLARWGCPQEPCYANCDQSTLNPTLTANDFMCFLNKYASADPAANCDGSTTLPALNANDFQCFINKFAAGCT